MKRFYQQAAAVRSDDGWQVQLDGRPVRTPARAPLLLPTQASADAVVAEWQGQGEKIDPASMPMTGFANAAIDQITPYRARFAEGIARYGESDLLCYRADGPAELVARQAALWDPLLDWARMRYDVAFRTTQGIIHVAQPPETLARLSATVASFDAFALAGLSTLVTLSGSLVCGLALIEGAADPDTIWQSSEIDELWQAEQWGEDAEATNRRNLRRTEFDGAVRFCRIVAA